MNNQLQLNIANVQSIIADFHSPKSHPLLNIENSKYSNLKSALHGRDTESPKIHIFINAWQLTIGNGFN